MLGQVPDVTMTRLTEEAGEGEETICVQDASGWAVGDWLGIAPTFLDPLEFDSVEITSISSDSCGTRIGVKELKEEGGLLYRHFGSTETDWSDHGDLDMRGEVVYLTRNIKIFGETGVNWGGQIVV